MTTITRDGLRRAAGHRAAAVSALQRSGDDFRTVGLEECLPEVLRYLDRLTER